MKQIRRRRRSVLMVLILVAAICASSFAWLIHSSSQLSSESALRISDLYLNEITTNTITNFNAQMDSYFASLESIVLIAEYSHIKNQKEFEEFLARMRNNYGLSFLAFVDEKGFYHNKDVVSPAASKISILGDLLSGKKNLISSSETIFGNNMLVLGTSFEPISYLDTKFVGIIMGIENSKLDEMLSLKREGANTASSIVKRNGSYIINNSTSMALPYGANIFAQLKKHAVFSGEFSLEKVRKDFSEGKSDLTCYETNGLQHYIYYIPIPDTDWYMLTTISYSVVNENVDSLSRQLIEDSFTVFFITMGTMIAVFVFYYVTMSRKEKELTEAGRLAEDSRASAEEALEIARLANESKSIFLSNMSHDIRTPMNAIIGLSAMLDRDAENPDKVREHVRKINASGQHLLSMINDVLDMSKIESGKTALNIAEINLAQMVEEIGTIIRPDAKAKHQHFKITADQIRHEHVLGDKLRINQILINLLSNAVKYTPEGGNICLTISEPKTSGNRHSLFRFEVKDDGYGMSEDYIKVIFDPFTREETNITSKIQGTGLGMAITKNLVELMGGTISVKSSPGKGSCFTVELEMRLQDIETDKYFWESYGIKRALIADDDEDVCIHAAKLMNESGVKTESALNGREAVELAKSASDKGQDFDMVILDQRMPVMSGVEAARQIRETIGENVPVLILTAYDISDIEDEAAEAGVDGFLPKPFFISNLKDTVEKINKKRNGITDKKETGCLEGKHFLAAEDNELNAEILCDLLSIKGASADIAENGSIAVKMFEKSYEGQYDAILMDIRMPVMNGYEAAKAIRSLNHPKAADIPIIALTANAFNEDVRDAIEAGMNAHIAKPINMDQLETILSDLLKVTD